MVNNADANDRDGARLVLKHSGATLTGTAGPNADQQFEVSSGKVTTEGGTESRTGTVDFERAK